MSEELPDPFMVAQVVREAQSVLVALGMPKEQSNERSALTLLVLLGMKPKRMLAREGKKDASPWSLLQPQRLGITAIMDRMRDVFAKKYAPNSRETVRRFTVHQFVQAGLVLLNPDDPKRPTNSPDNCYEPAPHVVELLRTFGTSDWPKNLAAFQVEAKSLASLYAGEREMQRIPLTLPNGDEIRLSPGGQNPLVESILREFCPRFTPGAAPIYVGDTGKKWAHFDEKLLASLGVTIADQHGKMPDVVVHHTSKNWLVLVEAVTSHGPMNPKRLIELRTLFAGSKAGLVFVTAFPDRKTMVRYLSDIAWETEVWVAEDPTHMIHFNGERFLGPYDK
jgi:hypothetical protein